ncbi:MAG: DUF1572 domain-containing protein [Bacteroidetes bacterium]|nr:MAG: DUF1572 domain-containing protein [Bacteroidota bacterium]REK05686.1 MAG: DUF1572 domain-containing protein [Bacteroidota bacterium]REK32008.1 MAG: DUF1572 domain-containing protein [Bacteroidota bacterium]REK50072.1 MAG: DUF1572 domain-containing protein [Bacteroidota bacterium]
MSLSVQLAKHFYEVHFGKNWTWSNLKDALEGVDWKDATTKFQDLNTIASLVFHMNYFVSAVLKVLEGSSLDAHDKYSFDLAPIRSESDWQLLQDKTMKEAQKFSELVSELPESKLWETFSEEKYGSYYRNIQGIIEHCHYHLGQIVVIKKLIAHQK